MVALSIDPGLQLCVLLCNNWPAVFKNICCGVIKGSHISPMACGEVPIQTLMCSGLEILHDML
jgi:hypothetical protein